MGRPDLEGWPLALLPQYVLRLTLDFRVWMERKVVDWSSGPPYIGQNPVLRRISRGVEVTDLDSRTLGRARGLKQGNIMIYLGPRHLSPFLHKKTKKYILKLLE